MARPGYLYILCCSDDSYYVGSTTNLEVRIAQHQAGEGGSFTGERLPVELIYSADFPTLHEAFLAERQLKGWSRAKKEALIRGHYDTLVELSRSKTRRLDSKTRLDHPEPVEGRPT
jgi:predicted GIY-YIG superfamily endonuclease